MVGLELVSLFVNGSAMFIEAVFKSTFGLILSVSRLTERGYFRHRKLVTNKHDRRLNE